MTAEDQGVATLIMIQTFRPDDTSAIYYAPLVIHHLMFVAGGILRYLHSLKDIRPSQWLVNLRNKNRIVKEMVKRRDIYRGDRSQHYRDLVENANLRAFSRYSPRSYKGSIVFVMPANRDLRGRKDPILYWRKLAEHGFKYLQLPGEDSGSLLKKPYVQRLADLLVEQLGDTGARS